jgi:hypothetical protein
MIILSQKKPSHTFRQAQYDQRAVSQSLSKTVGRYSILWQKAKQDDIALKKFELRN